MKVYVELTSWEVDLVGVDLVGGHLSLSLMANYIASDK